MVLVTAHYPNIKAGWIRLVDCKELFSLALSQRAHHSSAVHITDPSELINTELLKKGLLLFGHILLVATPQVSLIDVV